MEHDFSWTETFLWFWRQEKSCITRYDKKSAEYVSFSFKVCCFPSPGSSISNKEKQLDLHSIKYPRNTWQTQGSKNYTLFCMSMQISFPDCEGVYHFSAFHFILLYFSCLSAHFFPIDCKRGISWMHNERQKLTSRVIDFKAKNWGIKSLEEFSRV